MNTRKQRIFIGSSTETKELAKKIKEKIENYGNATAWWDDFFSMGEYVFNKLIQTAVSFDFAILIGGPDDKVTRISTHDEKISPRDNVYLEYGMFSGILSPNRILFLMHNDCRVASDLAGMMLAQYSSEEEAINASMEWLEKQLQGKREHRFTASDIELLPTVGIAVGYFLNFVEKIYKKELSLLDSFEYNGKEYEIDKVRLVIAVPDYIEKDPMNYENTVIRMFRLKRTMLNTFRILIDPKGLERGELIIYDVPNTLVAVFKTIDFIFGISEFDNEHSTYAKLRALDNFEDNVRRLVGSAGNLSRITEVQRVSLPE